MGTTGTPAAACSPSSWDLAMFAGVLYGLEAIEDSVVVEIKSPATEISAFFAMRK